MNIRQTDLMEAIVDNYIPYAEMTIKERAIPDIDGLKPSARRILYALYKMDGMKGHRKKSSKVVGNTMTWHPHGDASIYETMIRMTESYQALNVPYIDGKGNLGKTWSYGIKPAAARYTEVKLGKICEEVFSGINEDAVEFVDNFDNTEVEPVLLPVRFPSVIVNTSRGIAVSRSSNIPSFGLKEACQATIAILEGNIEKESDLVDILGLPDFNTGGVIYEDREQLLKLIKDGRGTFNISGIIETSKNTITIKELPYGITVENIIESITEKLKTEFIEIREVTDLTGEEGLQIHIELKNGSNTNQVIHKLMKHTRLNTQITFLTSVIIGNEFRELGIIELLKEWIEFRLKTIVNIYKHRINKQNAKLSLLETWEKIDDIRLLSNILVNNKYDEAKVKIKDRFKLTENQLEYIMDSRFRNLTIDKLNQRLKELGELKVYIQELEKVLNNDYIQRGIIKGELEEIIKKYGDERKTKIEEVNEHMHYREEDIPIENYKTTVYITQNNLIKKQTGNNLNGTKFKYEIKCNNIDDLFIFTLDGICHRIPVNDIGITKGEAKESIYSFMDVEDSNEILYITNREEGGCIRLIYNNGSGVIVFLDTIGNSRKKYRNVFESVKDRKDIWISHEDKFFVITKNRKATYVDLTNHTKFMRKAFRIGRLQDDTIFGIIELSKIPNLNDINLEKYKKNYFVKINKDRLW